MNQLTTASSEPQSYRISNASGLDGSLLATFLIHDGRFYENNKNAAIAPEQITTIDANGYVLLPGLVDLYSLSLIHI